MEKTFDNLAQRSINYFLATMPAFKAIKKTVKSEAASAKEQENAYKFIRRIYEKLYKDPGLLGIKIAPDDFFEGWWQPQKTKPGLAQKIRDGIKKINLFIEELYNIIYNGKADENTIRLSASDQNPDYKVKPALLKKLRGFDIAVEKCETEKNEPEYIFTFPAGVIPGLKLLASISTGYSKKSATVINNRAVSKFLLFSRGIYDPETPYTAEIFKGIVNNKEAFDKLIDYFDKKNFIRLDNKHDKGSLKGEVISLDYLKFYGKPEGRISSSWKTNNYSGIEFSFNELTRNFIVIGVHIPYFREALENGDKMSENLKDFLGSFLKCSGCRYCVQTDKTKTKPLRFVKVGDDNLCPLFVFGLMFDWLKNDMWLAEGIIELMEFIDDIFADRRVSY